jgi:hypothetical protein
MIAKGERPQLALVTREEVCAKLDASPFHVPAYMKRPAPPAIGETRCLWSMTGRMKIKVSSATYVNVKDFNQVRAFYLFQYLLYLRPIENGLVPRQILNIS